MIQWYTPKTIKSYPDFLLAHEYNLMQCYNSERKNQTECRLFDKITIQINVAPKLESRYTLLS